MATSNTRRYTAAFFVLTGLAAFGGASGSTSASSAVPSANGVAEITEFEVCKQYSGVAGPAVTIDYTVDFDGDGSIEISDSVELSHGECAIVHTYRETDFGLVQRVTVTEQVPGGYTATTTTTEVTGAGSNTIGPAPGNSASGDMLSNPDNGFLVVFTNTAVPTEVGTGRFTGGGTQELADGTKISRGLTIHCDLVLSNNLEVNWNGNKFHMTEHLTTVACTDNPNIDQNPPKAPLDTLIGTGTGRFNGVDGYTIEFTLVDGGEPGTQDRVKLLIYPTGNPAGAVLNVPLQALKTGNMQAHYDQPHK